MERSPRLSVRGVFYRDDAILLTKHKDDRGYWYITPGGGVQHGESLEQAFHREMSEELGLQTFFGDVLCVREIQNIDDPTHYLPKDFHQIEIFVRGEVGQPIQQASAPDKDQIGYEWVKLSQLPNLLFFPKTMVPFFVSREFPRIYLGQMS